MVTLLKLKKLFSINYKKRKIFFILLICLTSSLHIECVFPNFTSPRDECKHGTFRKEGKISMASKTCFLSYFLANERINSKGETIPGRITIDDANLICAKAIDNIQDCNSEHTLKTGLNDN